MKNVFVFGSLCFVIILFSSCAKIYHGPETDYIADSHEIIAILPPQVSILGRKKQDPELIREQEIFEAEGIHREMYAWMMERRSRRKLSVDILDVESTMVLLERGGYFEGEPMTPSEIAAMLDVDAVVSSSYQLAQPISEVAALALGVVLDLWVNTNEVQVNLDIHDRESRGAIWSYNHEVAGTAGSTHAALVDNLMRHASRRMPYSSR